MAAWPSSATWGEWLDRFQALAPRVLKIASTGPAGARRSSSDGRDRTNRSGRSAPRAGGAAADDRVRAAGLSVRARVRGDTRPGSRAELPRRVRARSGGTDVSAEAAGGSDDARRRPARPSIRRFRRSTGAWRRSACSCSWRLAPRQIAFTSRTPASSSVNRGPGCRLSTRSTSCARRPDACRTMTSSSSGRAMLVMRRWRGRRRRRQKTPSTTRSTTSPCSVACSTRRTRTRVKGHAHYLLKLNECLRRSVVDRWSRGQRRWSPNDGLTRVQPYTKDALAAQRLSARSYSASALQLFSACPYQFVLSAIYRLRPFEQPEPLQRMDPLTRGSLFHEIQASFFRTLQSQVGVAGDDGDHRLGASRARRGDRAGRASRARRAGAGGRAGVAGRARDDPARPPRLARIPRT